MKEGNIRKAAEIFGLPIISILQGAQLGRIKGAIVDPQKKEITAFLVEDVDWYKSRKVLPFSSVKSIGQDAVIIEKAEQIVEIKDAKSIEVVARQGIEVIGNDVMTVGGRSAGKVTEYSFDLESGALAVLEVEEAGKSSSIPTDKVVTIGRDAVIIAEEGEEELAAAVAKEAEEPSVEAPLVEEVEEEVKVEEVPPAPSVEEAPSGAVEEPAVAKTPLEEAPPEVEEKVKEEAKKEPEEKVEEKAAEAPGLKARQEDYLLGKAVTKDIIADDGTVIISAGEAITEEVIEKSKETKKFLMLSFWVER